MNNGLRDYLKSLGAQTLTRENCPALVEYDRAMREKVIPAIERDLKAQRRAAHFARLGIPDPLASVGRNAKRQDAQRLGPKDEHAVPKADAHEPPLFHQITT
jgi:hypothetical protein